MSLLRSHPDIALHIVPQWPFGSSVPKPTGLLALRIPGFKKSLFKHADPHAKRPKEVAIGRNQDGSYKTSRHKEYPTRFCAALAQCVTDQLDVSLASSDLRVVSSSVHDDALGQWIREAREACTAIRAGAQWLADYQGL